MTNCLLCKATDNTFWAEETWFINLVYKDFMSTRASNYEEIIALELDYLDCIFNSTLRILTRKGGRNGLKYIFKAIS